MPAPTAARTPAERLLALQRGAGNRRTEARLRPRRVLQRSIDDDLRAAPPPEPIPKGRVDLPAGTAKWTEGEQNWRIPMRVYALEDIPRELDGLTMGLGVRGAPDSPPVITARTPSPTFAATRPGLATAGRWRLASMPASCACWATTPPRSRQARR